MEKLAAFVRVASSLLFLYFIISLNCPKDTLKHNHQINRNISLAKEM
jgi:hypothetical protein